MVSVTNVVIKTSKGDRKTFLGNFIEKRLQKIFWPHSNKNFSANNTIQTYLGKKINKPLETRQNLPILNTVSTYGNLSFNFHFQWYKTLSLINYKCLLKKMFLTFYYFKKAKVGKEKKYQPKMVFNYPANQHILFGPIHL